jgi:hypothetical protein
MRGQKKKHAQRNPVPGECWGVLKTCIGYCWKKPRKGKLTCHVHAHCEQAAQELFAQTEGTDGGCQDVRDSLRPMPLRFLGSGGEHTGRASQGGP